LMNLGQAKVSELKNNKEQITNVCTKVCNRVNDSEILKLNESSTSRTACRTAGSKSPLLSEVKLCDFGVASHHLSKVHRVILLGIVDHDPC